MDESRRQDYRNLIQMLLNCPSGDEPRILRANSNLIDAGLVQTMLQIAAGLIVTGKLDASDFLMNVTGYLLGVYSSTPIKRLSSQDAPIAVGIGNSFAVIPEKYASLLGELMQATLDHRRNLEGVYPFLKANLDKLDDTFAQVLRDWATSLLSELEPAAAENLAVYIGNLGFLLQKFPLGCTASNLEIAITAYQFTVTVLSPECFPEEWANTHNNLGQAYRNRIRGDKPQNLEKAIAALQNALQVYTQKDFLQRWAMIKNNLGLVYREQGQIEQAVAAHEDALEGYSYHQEFLEEWADTQTYLGNVYSDKDEVDKAIAAYKKALKVRIPYTYKWAETQNNLATHYCKIGQIYQAIDIYKNNLQVYTQEFPERWATTHYNLARAYSKAGQIEQAIKAYQSALKVYTPAAFPIECLYCGNNLGHLAFDNGRLEEAIEAYGVAIEAVEQSWAWASTDARRQKIQTEAIGVYIGIVKSYVKTKQWKTAIEYAERSKARNLVQLLANRDLYPKGASESDCNQLKYLRREIAAKERQLETTQINFSTGIEENKQLLDQTYSEQLRQELDNLQQQLNDLLEQIKTLDPNFSFTQRVEPISFERIQALLPNDKTVLIEWYVLGDTFLTFIVTRQSPGITVWQSSPEDAQALFDWLREDFSDDEQPSKENWKNQLEFKLHRLAQILHLEEILSHVPETCDRVILIPHFLLHLLPLHALPLTFTDTSPVEEDRSLLAKKRESDADPARQKCLLDRFPEGVSYAPSCGLLQLTQNSQHFEFSYFFGIQNPTQDLNYADLEVETIRQDFHPNDKVLAREAATKQAIYNQQLHLAHCIHFSCHGYFDSEAPLRSALLLADATPTQTETSQIVNPERYIRLREGSTVNLGKCLTLGEIFGLELSQCRLVTLSACETGIISPNGLIDEYIGLPGGFLIAGSPCVVSSLWRVNDLSTALLMIKFYQNLKSGLTVAIALNQAQTWLRDATTEQLQQWASQLPNANHRMQLRAFLRTKLRNRKPFESPYYWAAFCAIGQ
ncbi:CHAT domain-containing protein [Coleofasciculus sp. E1-EBD-02]|uniref:CHAT domain-containing protein n=1 Tax=Coleofasciculus sp. E1-EBD-02 TaxID=3068481 RepID=UPI0032FF2026